MKADEKALETALVERLRSAVGEPAQLRSIAVATLDGRRVTLFDLIGPAQYTVIEDSNEFRSSVPLYPPPILQDVTGGVTPDIVIRSQAAGENRIYIEVKDQDNVRGEPAASQIVRQFLHLLCTTHHKPLKPDISRAVLLAAPGEWFKRRDPAWEFFKTYVPLAQVFDITLGFITLER